MAHSVNGAAVVKLPHRGPRALLVLAALLLSSFCFSSRQAASDDRSDIVRLAPDRGASYLVLRKQWSYHPGDDPVWADPAFDDSTWPLVAPDLIEADELPGGWPGIGWFRRRLVLDPSTESTTVGVHLHQAGASELYVDGELAGRFGTVSVDPELEHAVAPQALEAVTLTPGKVHLLAVRYSNAGDMVMMNGFRGFELRIGDINVMTEVGISFTRTYFGLMGGAIGMFGAFALLHLLLFLFRPALKENLYFTGFSLALVAVMATELWMNSLTDVASVRFACSVEMSFLVVMVLAALLLERQVFGRPIDAVFWGITVIGIGTLVWLWTQQAFIDHPALAVFMMLGFADMLRLAVGALLRREPDAWVVALGFTALALSFIGSLLRNLGLLRVSPWPMFIAGTGTLVVALSVYLTRRVARTNRELARRLAEVEELTSRSLEQEREAREREIARRVLEADNRRKTAELEEARRLQIAMLPQQLPDLAGWELAVHMATASEVGGDYYDFLRDGDGGWTVALGDATGHGLQAGMVVGVAKSLLQSANGVGDLRTMLERIHAGLATLQERRASMSMLLLHLNGTELRIASAGMPPLLIRRQGSGAVEEILLPGVPLGILQEAEWREAEVAVAPGDTLLLMSDGLAEVPGPAGELFGYDRVQRTLREAGDLDPAGTLSHLVAAADSYRGGEPIPDDVTLMALRARGS